MFRPRWPSGTASQTLHGLRFPGESAEYRRARDELLQAEIELRRQTERVAAQRRELPLGGVVPTDYVFDEWDDAAGAPREVRLSELFDGRDTLLLYSFMIVPPEQELPFVGPCPSCTSIIDGIDGALPHITQRLAFAVAAKPPIDEFRRYGDRRGWRHARSYGRAEPLQPRLRRRDRGGYQWPLATVFVRRDDGVHHFWSSELFFGPRDPAKARGTWTSCGRCGRCSTARRGRGDWDAALEYGG